MIKFLEARIFLTSFCLVGLSGAQDMRKKNSLLAPFEDGNPYLPYWDFTGTSEVTHDFIRLTSDEPGKRGAIWNNSPNQLRDWEFQTRFSIHGKGVNLSGDGMAIWYTRESLHLGPVFGSKDYFSGLAVFIDTYKNFNADDDTSNGYNYPYISVMVNNGSLHYNGAQDGRYTTIGGCHAKVRNMETISKIAVSYIQSVLMVFLDLEGTGDWKQCFKSHGIHLPTDYYFGVSASTGELSDNHDVYSIKVLDLEPEDSEQEDRSGIMPEAEHFVLPKEWEGTVEVERIHSSNEETLSSPTVLGMILCGVVLNSMLIAIIVFCKRHFEQRKQRAKVEHKVHIILYPDSENVF